MFPFIRVGYQDQDNFIRNLVTVLFAGGAWQQAPTGTYPVTSRYTPLSPSVSAADPILTLPEIKLHCRIELDQTDEDTLLTSLERAAHIHTANILRRSLDAAAVGENVKQAMLLLIAHWYRNREAITANEMYCVPEAFHALLSPERDYPLGTY